MQNSCQDAGTYARSIPVYQCLCAINYQRYGEDSSGEPIISASVLVTGTHEGVQTDIDGNFD